MNGSIYIHIPFCLRKCGYCHFYSVVPRPEQIASFVQALKTEWQQYKNLFSDITSVYLGGGTPSLLHPSYIEEILADIPTNPSTEITIEANPDSIKYLSDYRSLGINRISIGIQSLEDSLLLLLTRKHNAAQAIAAVEHAHKTGFDNISIDLMYDIPQQALHQWQNTLLQALRLPITHLSIYNLTIEPHTAFFKHQHKIQKQTPDEHTSLQMFEMAQQMTAQQGFQQYEISAFCKPGLSSQHNLGYWIRRNFIGLGPSAFSYLDGRRFQNTTNLSQYQDKLQHNTYPVSFEEKLPPAQHKKEMLAIQLRVLEGVNISELENIPPSLIKQNLLTIENNKIKLTQKGILFYDTIAEEII
jgi:oxygen-independent coproporphyrinogen III oxidase